MVTIWGFHQTIRASRASPTIGDSIANSSCLLILLLSLLCGRGLRAIIRGVLRHNGRFPFESAEAATARLGSNGLEKDELRKIRVLVYEPGLKMVYGVSKICLGEFQQGENLRMLPRCNHGFHVMCIDEWFSSHSSCPTCRQLLSWPENEEFGVFHPMFWYSH